MVVAGCLGSHTHSGPTLINYSRFIHVLTLWQCPFLKVLDRGCSRISKEQDGLIFHSSGTNRGLIFLNINYIEGHLLRMDQWKLLCLEYVMNGGPCKNMLLVPELGICFVPTCSTLVCFL